MAERNAQAVGEIASEREVHRGNRLTAKTFSGMGGVLSGWSRRNFNPNRGYCQLGYTDLH